MIGISKITAKAVLGKIEAPTERTEVLNISGRVDKVTKKPSQFNPDNVDVRLRGEFICTNLLTGEVFTSALLYPMGSGMTEVMGAASEGSLFAMRVYLDPSKQSPTGYSFDFRTALEIKPSEQVSQLNNVFLQLENKDMVDVETVANRKRK